MNKETFNRSINDIEIPLEKLVEREKAAMFQAKKRRKVKRTTQRSFLVASGLCMTLFASGFVSTDMAKALSIIPVIGPIYAQFNDIASEKIQKDNLATIIEKEDRHDNLTMTVKEAVYDGGRLVVTVEYKGNNPISNHDEGNAGFSYITINGGEPNVSIGSSRQKSRDAHTIVQSHEFTLSNYDEYGDEVEVAVHGENLFGSKGKWNVDFPLKKVKGDIYEFYPQEKVETMDKIYSIRADKVIFSPLATRIDLTIDYPAIMDENDTWPWFNFSIVDDKGNVYDEVNLQEGMAGKNGRHMVLVLPPMERLPQSFTLKPSDLNRESKVVTIKELELVIPLEK